MPLGSELVVIVRALGLMVRLSDLVAAAAVGLAESVTITVTVPLNGAVGVPLIVLPVTLSVEGRPDAVNV